MFTGTLMDIVFGFSGNGHLVGLSNIVKISNGLNIVKKSCFARYTCKSRLCSHGFIAVSTIKNFEGFSRCYYLSSTQI